MNDSVETLVDPTLSDRRFAGVTRLYGEAAFAAIRRAHVVVVGIGGVGSWAAESLARSGVGALTLIDLDVVAESNLNRQAHASLANLGRNKVDAMRERILGFAPDCLVSIVDDFVTPDNVATALPTSATAVIDAIDQVRAKAALVAYCVAKQLPVIVCGAKLRGDLRKIYGFPRGDKKFSVTAIYSQAQQLGGADDAGAGLACAGYGSVMHMTAGLGLAAAGELLRRIAAETR
jgi:tRNA threonylcarbamoyladenosine dehydratase